LDTYQFEAIDAEFYGFEAQLDYELFKSVDSTVLLSFMSDAVKTRNKDSGDDLPRIPPLRIGSRLGLTHGNWESGVELRYAFEQTDVAAEETDTDGYTQLNADLRYRVELSDSSAVVFFLRAENLLDEEIRNHSSFLKDEAPLPGRNFTLGGRFEF
jgi:iron complex outermembrane receptor protein